MAGHVSDTAKRDCCHYKYLLACYQVCLPAHGHWRCIRHETAVMYEHVNTASLYTHLCVRIYSVYLGCLLCECLPYTNLNRIIFTPVATSLSALLPLGAEHSQQVSWNNYVAALSNISLCLASIPKHSLMSLCLSPADSGMSHGANVWLDVL